MSPISSVSQPGAITPVRDGRAGILRGTPLTRTRPPTAAEFRVGADASPPVRLACTGGGNDDIQMINATAAALRRVRRLDTVPARPGAGPVPTGRRALHAPKGPTLAPTARLRPWIVAIGVAFTVCRLAYAAAGVRFDDSALHPATASQVQWQLLPLNLLRHDLGRSIWNLHSQPPLYNLFCGALLHLPAGWQRPLAASVYLGLGLSLAFLTFLLLEELGLGRRAAFVVTLIVIADPATVLYENWLSWSYPTAVMLTAGMYFMLRWAKAGSSTWAGGSMACFAAVVLLDATFQWPWLLAMAGLTVSVRRPHWRKVLAAIALPIALAGGWCVKDAVQFGSPATSSWLGMNLYQATLGLAHPGDLRELVRSGKLDRTALVFAFKPVDAYASLFPAQPHTGVAATDVRATPQGTPNYNNALYLEVSRDYLRDDLAYIRLRPSRYASAVTVGTEIWAVPADQYGWVNANYSRISPYGRLYDTALMLQPEAGGWRAGENAEFHGTRPPAATISWTAAVVTLVAVLLAPVVLVLRRRNRIWLACGAAMWSTVLYSFVITSLSETGENMRFRFELGTIPMVLAVATVTAWATTNRETPAGRAQVS